MKSIQQFLRDLGFTGRGGLSQAMEARDAEWRRLVEEAQADLTAAREALIREGMERDRFKAESAAREVTIETLGAELAKLQGENEKIRRVWADDTADYDRLKGKLAEARSIVADLKLYVQARHRAQKWLDTFAAPPAEQAQPKHRETERAESERWKGVARSAVVRCSAPDSVGDDCDIEQEGNVACAAGQCAMRPGPGDLTPQGEPAEQAQSTGPVQVARERDGTPIMCDTPGCGKPIPPGDAPAEVAGPVKS